MDEEITTALRVARLICASFLIAAFIYVALFYVALQQGIAPVMSGKNLMGLITVTLAVIGMICLAGGYYLPKYLIRQAKKKQSEFGIRGTLVSASIISFAFFESIAIYGLILGLLSARWEIILPFVGTSIVAMALNFPTRERWEGL